MLNSVEFRSTRAGTCWKTLCIWPNYAWFGSVHRCQYWAEWIPWNSCHGCRTANKQTTRPWVWKILFFFSKIWTMSHTMNFLKILRFFAFQQQKKIHRIGLKSKLLCVDRQTNRMSFQIFTQWMKQKSMWNVSKTMSENISFWWQMS